MTELQIVRTRHQLPDTFTTSEFRQQAHNNGIQDERGAIDWLIDHNQIKRVKVGHYEKTNRYKGER